jgi:hypothetical protein
VGDKMTVVSIQGLDKAEVLASLYNAVKADLEWQKGEEQLTVEDAESLLYILVLISSPERLIPKNRPRRYKKYH